MFGSNKVAGLVLIQVLIWNVNGQILKAFPTATYTGSCTRSLLPTPKIIPVTPKCSYLPTPNILTTISPGITGVISPRPSPTIITKPVIPLPKTIINPVPTCPNLAVPSVVNPTCVGIPEIAPFPCLESIINPCGCSALTDYCPARMLNPLALPQVVNPTCVGVPEIASVPYLEALISPCGCQARMINPFLPAASPVSALAPTVSALLPPALPCDCSCTFLKQIPIPPPFI